MKIKNIKTGTTVKNYKELCLLLEIEPVGGKSKILQLKELERYIRYHKDGNKFVIEEVYDSILERTKKRGGNNKVFIDDFKTLILHMIHNNIEKKELVLSKSALYKASNLVSDNYLDARMNIPKLAEIINLPQIAIYEFYDYNSTKIKQTADRNLRKMRSEALIIMEDVHAVAIKENVIGSKEKVEIHRQATKEENSIILKFEKEVMESMNYSNLQQVFLSGKWKQFKNEVEDKLKIAGTNIMYYYGAYRITWNVENINKEYNKYCKDIDIDNIKSNLNNNMQESILKANKTRYTKAKKLNSFGDAITPKIEYQRSENYLDEQCQITFTLIDAKAKSLRYELREPIKKHKNLNKINNIEQIEFNSDIPF